MENIFLMFVALLASRYNDISNSLGRGKYSISRLINTQLERQRLNGICLCVFPFLATNASH